MRVVLEAFVKKLSIFVIQKMAVPQNGVEFCQQFIGAIRFSLHYIVGCCPTSRLAWGKLADDTHTHNPMYRGSMLPK